MSGVKYIVGATAAHSSQIQASQAIVSGQPMPRQVSHTTPSGVSHRGHALSGRRRRRSTIRVAPKPPRSLWSTAEQAAAPSGRGPGTVRRFHTRLVAPHPWLSLAPTTNRPVRRASATTESRRARVISFALGAAFTISKPSAPAATSESSRAQ